MPETCAPWWWPRPPAERSAPLRWRAFRPAARLFPRAWDGTSAQVPDIAQNFARVVLQQRGELAIGVPGAGDGALEYFRGAGEIARCDGT